MQTQMAIDKSTKLRLNSDMVGSFPCNSCAGDAQRRRCRRTNRSTGVGSSFGFSTSFPSFTIPGVPTLTPLVRQPGYLKRYFVRRMSADDARNALGVTGQGAHPAALNISRRQTETSNRNGVHTVPKLFLTGHDQIIDLDYVAAIEIMDGLAKYASVHFRLSTGVTIVSRHDSHEAAATEKWQAYQRISPCKESMPSQSTAGRAATG